MLFENGGQGYRAVYISIMVAPTLHTSALRPCPVCLTISGAIHGMDPRIVRRLSSKLWQCKQAFEKVFRSVKECALLVGFPREVGCPFAFASLQVLGFGYES